MYKKTALLLLGVTLISCSPSNNPETTTSSSINEEKIEIHTVFSRLNDISKENFLEFSCCSSGIATVPYTINKTHYINSKENKILILKELSTWHFVVSLFSLHHVFFIISDLF